MRSLTSKNGYLFTLILAIILLIVSYSLWEKIFLPNLYLFGTLLASIILAISIVKEKNQRFIVIQLFLVFLLLNNVYALSTSFAVLPYGDSYWEYAVVKTFEEESSLSIIASSTSSASKLTWYSGWPFIHSFAIVFSGMTGFNVFQTLLIIPVIIGVATFLILYIFLDRLRLKLNFGKELVTFALLLYVISPDSIFWRTQFVRQNLGVLLLVSLFVVTYWLMSFSNQRRKMALMAFMFILSLVIAHHLTSFVTMFYFFLLFGLWYFEGIVSKRNLFKRIRSINLGASHIALVLGFITLIAIYIYWDNVSGPIIYPVAKSRIDRFLDVLTGMRSTDFFVPQAIYPNQLTTSWVLLLLNFRDIAIYFPALLGLFLLWKKGTQNISKSFIILSTVAFGLFFIINNLTFRLEPYRLIMMSLPFIVFLSGIAYNELKSRNYLSKILYLLLIFIIFPSFIGLWGHNFAPIHLYDPSINSITLGENISSKPIQEYVNTQISIEELDLLWTDNVGALLTILPTNQYEKIRSISPSLIDRLGDIGNEAYFEFSDSYLYKYYAGVYSPISTPEEAVVFRTDLKNKLNSELTLIYDDDIFRIWMTKE